MIEWLTLAELAGKPVLKEVIQMFRGKVRKSIDKTIEISEGKNHIAEGRGFAVVFGIEIVSKTPARVRIVGVDYVIKQHSNAIQSGYWRTPLLESSVGYPTSILLIKGNRNDEFKVAMSPVILGRWPIDNRGWEVSGVLEIDCSYGVIRKQFSLGPFMIASEDEWKKLGAKFEALFRSQYAAS